ncbi:isoamylase early set domain-containing protein [uncultured Desulfosarcina sp.]|uniref:isoamylase early set domain-containing protein n=1 Tax=uncultured Desulfosarcina sp. TaxID=218289 RepID=UPI0029C6D38E|nr:isoamylase early set domain-containing protein [uncultured Desulfosarcina sp.]
MSIRKQFLKTKPVCKVTFTVPESLGEKSEFAHVVGDFNGWSTSATPMKKLKTGGFSATVELETNQSYQFRYLLGDAEWGNDPDADGQTPTPYGDSYNSVIHLSH